MDNDANRVFRGARLRVLKWFPAAPHDDPDMNAANDRLIDYLMGQDELSIAQQADLIEGMSDAEARKIAMAEVKPKETPKPAETKATGKKAATKPVTKAKPKVEPKVEPVKPKAKPKTKTKAKPQSARLANEQAWRERMLDNVIFTKIKVFGKAAHDVAKGRNVAAFLSGPPGVGKTFIAKRELRRAGVKWRIAKAQSPAGLVALLRYNGVLLFDESDHLWMNQQMINYLKQACDTDRREKRMVSYDVKKVSIPIEVKARVIFCTNLNLKDASLFGKAQYQHIEAICNREPPKVMARDRKALWEYSCYLAIVHGLLKREDVSLEAANDALRYFTENMWRLRELSPRTLIRIARVRHDALKHPDPDGPTWREMLEDDLIEQAQEQSIPEIPRIVI